MPAEQRRPQVTLTSSSLHSAAVQEASDPAPRGRPVVLLLLPLLALVLALTTGRSPPPPPPPAPATVDAELLLLGERLSMTQSGILVLPVELRNRGGALTVQRAEPYGFPLRADPSVLAPPDVAAGERRRFVMLVAPECRLLGGGAELFEASLLLRVVAGTSSRNIVLDLTDNGLVRERVAGLCA